MARLILVCGPTGAGKTSYSIALCEEIEAIRFSIDPWMQTLYSKDMTSLDYSWMIERVMRCYEQIWEVAGQVLKYNGNVVLDLGFTTKELREYFSSRAIKINVTPEVHYIDASKEIREKRIEKRNTVKDPLVYSFEVNEMMFNFMESRFEVPDKEELKNGLKVNT